MPAFICEMIRITIMGFWEKIFLLMVNARIYSFTKWFVSLLPLKVSFGKIKLTTTLGHMESISDADLPEEVIHEILLRLPVKTLCRFKCVCKQWYTLIGSQSFKNKHFGHESNQERLLIRHDNPNEEGYTFALYVDEMNSGYEEPDHLQMPDTVDDLIGPVNGVFCVISKSGRMALLNPAMRQFKPLPLHHPNVQPHLSSHGYFFGFGLDPLNGNCKLVSLRCLSVQEMDDPIYPPYVSVYNSGSDSWRHLEDVSLVNSLLCAFGSRGTTCLNGIYYLLVRLDGVSGNTEIAILAFDSSEKNTSSREGWYLDLVLNGDSIALLSYDYLARNDRCIDVWALKKEGYWTKNYTVGPLEDMRWPLCFWKKNELLIETRTSPLTLCNVSTQKLRTVEARRRENGCFISWVFSYKESLVSIKGEGGNCKLWDTSSDFVKDFFK